MMQRIHSAAATRLHRLLSYAGKLFGINTYNQPAVELGKEATFALMDHPDYQDLLKDIQKTLQLD